MRITFKGVSKFQTEPDKGAFSSHRGSTSVESGTKDDMRVYDDSKRRAQQGGAEKTTFHTYNIHNAGCSRAARAEEEILEAYGGNDSISNLDSNLDPDWHVGDSYTPANRTGFIRGDGYPHRDPKINRHSQYNHTCPASSASRAYTHPSYLLPCPSGPPGEGTVHRDS